MTATKPELIEFLRAVLKGETGRFAELRTVMSERANMREFSMVTSAALFTAAPQRFVRGEDSREIAKYLLETKTRAGMSDEDFPPAVMEAIVRAALGEDHLLEGVDLTQTIPAQMAIVKRIIIDDELSPEEIDHFVEKVQRLVSAAD